MAQVYAEIDNSFLLLQAVCPVCTFCCIADSPPTAICLRRRMKLITFEQAQFSATQEQQIIEKWFSLETSL